MHKWVMPWPFLLCTFGWISLFTSPSFLACSLKGITVMGTRNGNGLLGAVARRFRVVAMLIDTFVHFFFVHRLNSHPTEMDDSSRQHSLDIRSRHARFVLD